MTASLVLGITIYYLILCSIQYIKGRAWSDVALLVVLSLIVLAFLDRIFYPLGSILIGGFHVVLISGGMLTTLVSVFKERKASNAIEKQSDDDEGDSGSLGC